MRTHVPIGPPSALRIATVAERGRPSGLKSGQLEYRLGSAGLLCRLGTSRPSSRGVSGSPGCWMLTNIVRPSGVSAMPVISQPTGPVRKRRTSPVAGSQARGKWGHPLAGPSQVVKPYPCIACNCDACLVKPIRIA